MASPRHSFTSSSRRCSMTLLPTVMDKAQQQSNVLTSVKENNLIHDCYAESEVDYFFNQLGVDLSYFQHNKPQVIADHITALYACKLLYSTGDNEQNRFSIDRSDEKNAVFFRGCGDTAPCTDVERHVEELYFGEGCSGSDCNVEQPWRCQVYRTTGVISEDIPIRLRMYHLYKTEFEESKDSSFRSMCCKIFNAKTSEADKKLFEELMKKATSQLAPVVASTDAVGIKNCKRVIVVYKHGTTHSMFSSFTHLYTTMGLYSVKKFVAHYKNGYSSYAIYLCGAGDPDQAELEKRVAACIAQVSNLYALPKTLLSPLAYDNTLTWPETCYGYAAWKFAYHFMSNHRNEYLALRDAFKHDNTHLELLLALQKAMHKETFTEERLIAVVTSYPQVVKYLYANFAKRHMPDAHMKLSAALPDIAEVEHYIKREVFAEFDQGVMFAMARFNQHVLKTNFYKHNKVAFAFRLDPSFLPSEEYPQQPFGIFFIVGSEFRGFHVRFKDIARGGIRIIKSANAEAYRTNSSSVFRENYDLANTQQRKNKDIPEGGSKGTILLSREHQNKGEVAFHKYVDALLDCILLPCDDIVDHFQQLEVLFLGPDEWTADLMSWAAHHAKTRGYRFWKAITTGKPRSMGGIPHDMYGMTTRSVRQSIRGIQDHLELKEKDQTKFMTGGPDGDLGSNEILMNEHRITGIVDGSGVVHDPAGLNRDELVRLANERKMVNNFNKKKLSKKGFFVSIEDRDVKLPDGSVVENGLLFRNGFHLDARSSADFFVPCGGRPQAVNSTNYKRMLDADGNPRHKYVVEGANLFYTQTTRLHMERAGIIQVKDATANKGGVTSSSQEVFAALCMSDDEHKQHMCVPENGKVPAFYEKYKDDVIKIVEDNARMEFECIWKEHKETGAPFTLISDTLSNKINALNYSLQESKLWNDVKLRKKVISNAISPTMLKFLGIEKVLERVPENYLRSIFGAHLSSRFIYAHGINAPEFGFWNFMQKY